MLSRLAREAAYADGNSERSFTCQPTTIGSAQASPVFTMVVFVVVTVRYSSSPISEILRHWYTTLGEPVVIPDVVLVSGANTWRGVENVLSHLRSNVMPLSNHSSIGTWSYHDFAYLPATTKPIPHLCKGPARAVLDLDGIGESVVLRANSWTEPPSM